MPQGVANRGVRIIEKHLRMHRVDRAKDLPEEAKVRLLRDLKTFFESEKHDGGTKHRAGAGTRGFWARLRDKIENFLSFSEANAGATTVLCMYGGGGCVTFPRREES